MESNGFCPINRCRFAFFNVNRSSDRSLLMVAAFTPDRRRAFLKASIRSAEICEILAA